MAQITIIGEVFLTEKACLEQNIVHQIPQSKQAKKINVMCQHKAEENKGFNIQKFQPGTNASEFGFSRESECSLKPTQKTQFDTYISKPTK
jgi:hypothetical protein